MDVQNGAVVGFICPKCLKPSELQKLPEGVDLDIGYGYEEAEPVTGGNFKFLKKKVDAPDYYGPREARFDWEEFSDLLRRALETLPGNLKINLEIQTLWNFSLSIEKQSNGAKVIRSTGYHTHGGKKGKQVDEPLVKNLKSMGLEQPEGEERNWVISLTPEESVDHHLNKIVVHILERGYEFNPNLIQDLLFEEF